MQAGATESGLLINAGLILVSAIGSSAMLNLAGATISGGKLQTSGGSALIATASGTADTIKDATIVSGSLINILSASTLTVSGGSIGTGASVETASGGTAIVSGTVTNAGTLFASGSGSRVDIVGVVKGGISEVGDGLVVMHGPSSENVLFSSDGSGGLVLTDRAGHATDYKGKISGFGSTTTQFIDLTSVGFDSSVSATYTSAASDTSGTLTVTSGASSTIVAKITLVGSGYSTANFQPIDDGTGHVKIIDPPADGFDSATTLAHISGSNSTLSDGAGAAAITLLGHYMAASFVAVGPQGGELLFHAAKTSNTAPVLTLPHT